MLKWLLALVFLAVGWVAYYLWMPLALPATPFEFNIKNGTSMKGASRQLAQSGLLSQPTLFTWVARVSGNGSALKAGNYELDAPLTPWQLLQRLTKGDVTQSEFKFIEGWNFNQLRAALNAAPDLSHDTQALSDAEIMAKLGAPNQHPEGRFFPDTYFFSAGMSDLKILSRAYKLMQAQLHTAWAERAPGLPYATAEEALIMASIIEKETGLASERPQIAGVFLNRLRMGMLLQTDPTVIYGLGAQYDGNLHKRDLLTDTPYNTYTRAGLPPTPIAMPGMESIRAALHPATTSALYFVARGDGSHQFSANLADHNAAVNRYQRRP